MKTTRIERLKALRSALLDCCVESVNNAEEWQTFRQMKGKVDEMIHDERKRLGYSGVYEIVNGCSGDCLFEGSLDSCRFYVDILIENQPERKGNIIITPLY